LMQGGYSLSPKWVRLSSAPILPLLFSNRRKTLESRP
jgi:hypothetical protein